MKKLVMATFTVFLLILPAFAVTAVTGDVNGDGKVNIEDVAIAARAFGSYPGHPRWNAEADLNGDLRVDMRDITIVCLNFGK